MSERVTCGTSQGILTMTTNSESGMFAKGVMGVSTWIPCDCGHQSLIKTEIGQEVLLDVYKVRAVLDTLLDAVTTLHTLHLEIRGTKR